MPSPGDRVKLAARTPGQTATLAEIIEVHGSEAQPPIVVRFPDGHKTLVFPGPDTEYLPPGDI
ncbi:hypothetical protein BJY01DRAFT_219224 [Aspergillus pseudoustus]|uniref:DUF1918 domain-containing protein n=1 Tax=Aspergillus pseudoustus TaxID=1810923 RepID=A0ABR4JHH6_9EURO